MACRRWAWRFRRFAETAGVQFQLREFDQHVRKAHAADHFLAHPHVVETDCDEPRRVELRRIGSGGDVVEVDAPEVKHEVRALDDFTGALRRHRTRVEASELRMALVDDAFFHRCSRKRAAQRFDGVSQLLLQPKARDREGRQSNNRLRTLEPFVDGGDHLF